LVCGGLLGLTFGYVHRERPFDWSTDLRPWSLLIKVPLCVLVGLAAFLSRFPHLRDEVALQFALLFAFLCMAPWIAAGLSRKPATNLVFVPRPPQLWELSFHSAATLILIGFAVTSREPWVVLWAVLTTLDTLQSAYYYFWGVPQRAKPTFSPLQAGH
jgi:hypothetical protein